MHRSVKLALIGAGNRGRGTFGQYALDMPHRASFSAVVEPDPVKRNSFGDMHGIPDTHRFADLDVFRSADLSGIEGAVIASHEDQRLPPALACMEKEFHLLLEKPLCRTPEELMAFYRATNEYPGIILVCHQMRLTPIFRTIKRLIDSGDYGEIVCIQHSENLSYDHMAHSFVRGFFNHSRLSPMLLAKSCHDLDILTHLTGRPVLSVASFGNLLYFTPERRPEGAPDVCLDGCPHEASCPYSVMKLYFNDDTDSAYLRQMGVDVDRAALMKLLQTNRFGKCVFAAGNDVVDHQSVILDFEGGITASFTMCGHNGRERRMTRISLTNGEIEYPGMGRFIRAWSFEPKFEHELHVPVTGTHGGGDRAIMDNFLDAIETGDRSRLLTPIADSFEGHLAVFAAEESRRTGTVVEPRAYAQTLQDADLEIGHSLLAVGH